MKLKISSPTVRFTGFMCVCQVQCTAVRYNGFRTYAHPVCVGWSAVTDLCSSTVAVCGRSLQNGVIMTSLWLQGMGRHCHHVTLTPQSIKPVILTPSVFPPPRHTPVIPHHYVTLPHTRHSSPLRHPPTHPSHLRHPPPHTSFNQPLRHRPTHPSFRRSPYSRRPSIARPWLAL